MIISQDPGPSEIPKSPSICRWIIRIRQPVDGTWPIHKHTCGHKTWSFEMYHLCGRWGHGQTKIKRRLCPKRGRRNQSIPRIIRHLTLWCQMAHPRITLPPHPTSGCLKGEWIQIFAKKFIIMNSYKSKTLKNHFHSSNFIYRTVKNKNLKNSLTNIKSSQNKNF